jgi:hypothetical protein
MPETGDSRHPSSFRPGKIHLAIPTLPTPPFREFTVRPKSIEVPLAPSGLQLEAVFFTSDVRWKAVDRPPLPRLAGYARESVGPIQPLVRHIPNKRHVAKEAAGGSMFLLFAPLVLLAGCSNDSSSVGPSNSAPQIGPGAPGPGAPGPGGPTNSIGGIR